MERDFSRLRGRIVEKYGSIQAFAEDIGKSPSSVGQRLAGTVDISLDDVDIWCDKLDIDVSYFFNRPVAKT